MHNLYKCMQMLCSLPWKGPEGNSLGIRSSSAAGWAAIIVERTGEHAAGTGRGVRPRGPPELRAGSPEGRAAASTAAGSCLQLSRCLARILISSRLPNSAWWEKKGHTRNQPMPRGGCLRFSAGSRDARAGGTPGGATRVLACRACCWAHAPRAAMAPGSPLRGEPRLSIPWQGLSFQEAPLRDRRTLSCSLLPHGRG